MKKSGMTSRELVDHMKYRHVFARKMVETMNIFFGRDVCRVSGVDGHIVNFDIRYRKTSQVYHIKDRFDGIDYVFNASYKPDLKKMMEMGELTNDWMTPKMFAECFEFLAGLYMELNEVGTNE